MKQLFAVFAITLAVAPSVMAETYNIDAKHSFANFSIRHVVSKTSGTFTDITGVIKIDRDHLADASVTAIIDMNSFQSGHAKRDEHVKDKKYLNVMEFGEMTFVSKKIITSCATEGMMTGDLTLHGVTKEITMPIKVLGFGADPWGGQRAGFESKLTIKASDYGYSWMSGENPPVGNTIEVTLLIEGIKAKEELEIFKKK